MSKDVQPIKYRIFLQSDPDTVYHESYTDYKIAVGSERIPIPIVFDLNFNKLKEGEIIPESGKIKFEYCCVENRRIMKEDNELVVIIYGNLCEFL